jgi:uncharacterized repeat protein (TIGR01451 family)
MQATIPDLLDSDASQKLGSDLGALAAGESRTVSLTVRPRRVGKADCVLMATASGGLTGSASYTLDIHDAALTLKLTGPTMRYAGKPAEWTLEIANNGATSLQQVQVRDQLPPELDFVSAPEGGRLTGREVVWDLGALAPSQSRSLRLVTTAQRLTPQTYNVAIASGQPATVAAKPGDPVSPMLGTLTTNARAPLTIQGLPALKLEVTNLVNPLDVNGRTTYSVRVINQGTLAGDRIKIVARLPKQTRFVSASGPSRFQIVGDRVEFDPVDGLPPNMMATYQIAVQGAEPGEDRFHVELTATALEQPVVREESTTVR